MLPSTQKARMDARARAIRIWGSEEVADDWMFGHNGHLGGARPIDALLLGQVEDVHKALDAVEAGGYA